jgi:hypothetical protein
MQEEVTQLVLHFMLHCRAVQAALAATASRKLHFDERPEFAHAPLT